jgi:hypothetical protein
MAAPTNDLCRIVLEALPTGVFVVNCEGNVTLWSAGAEKHRYRLFLPMSSSGLRSCS